MGAGVAGLTAAADLARRGADVTILERAASHGGKMRHVMVDGRGIDGGPTVFTMRWIFEGLFADAGESLSDHLGVYSTNVLARHAWRAGGRLDLFADIEASVQAIGDFAGAADARGYRDFCTRAAAIYRTLEGSFIGAEKPSQLDLVRRVGLSRLGELWRTAPFRSMWSALGDHFSDPRLRQLFGRYATYVGASPWFAPATLMLVAHVEQDGVWLVQGGMRAVADALRGLAERQGARLRCGADVTRIIIEGGRAKGVELANGERLMADAVLFNGDAAALPSLGAQSPAPGPKPVQRSLSAITWCVNAPISGFDLAHHNVFFAEDYAEEFRAIFNRREVTAAPTIYICAQDRGLQPPPPGTPERLLLLINAPADGDSRDFNASDYIARTQALLASCGLHIGEGSAVATTPSGFNALFPATGGALYGMASHGATATLRRSGARGKIPGLYLAGGSVHPGPGVPMAAMSGRLAAARLLEDAAGRSTSVGFAPGRRSR